MKKIYLTLFLALFLLSISLISCTDSQTNVSAKEFYNGKTVTLVANGSPGQGTDLTSRVIAKYLGIDINGNVIVENRRAAGGLEGINYVYQAAPDGLTLGMLSSVKFISNKILDDPAATYEIDGFSYIMRIDNQRTFFFISTNSPYQTIDDLKTATELKIAAGSASGHNTLAGVTIIELLDLDAKVVTGFDGNTERLLATQRGEVIGYAQGISSLQSEIDMGIVKPLFVLSTTRDPNMPDVPAITELVTLSGEDLDLINLWESGLYSSYILFGPAAMTDENLKYFIEMAEGWSKDESFCQEINLITGYEVSEYIFGQQIEEPLFDMVSSIESFNAKFTELIEKYRL